MVNQDPQVQNSATDQSSVGIQAEQVHNSTVYMRSPDMSAEEKFQKGVNALKGGLAGRARDFINDAIADDYDNGEVRFYWFLAMLSKRSFRELSRDEKEELRSAQSSLENYPNDEWKQGLETICALLNRMNDVEADPEPELKALRELPRRQSALIGDHLEMILSGSLKDAVWADKRQAAQHLRYENDRENRVWAFFEPEPAEPEVRAPELNFTPMREKILLGFSLTIFTVSFGYLGWLVLSNGSLFPLFVYPLIVGGLYVGVKYSVEWKFRVERLQAKDRELTGIPRTARPLADGFSRSVKSSFDYYFYKYAPNGIDRGRWLSDTKGVRRFLADEITELCRNKSRLENIRWLIRRLVIEVRKRWVDETLWEYRERYRTSGSIKLRCCIGMLTAIAGVALIVESAVSVNPVLAVFSFVVMVIAGWKAMGGWMKITVEQRCFDDEWEEYARELARRREWHTDWVARLKSLTPSDEEMERWLNADKTLFLDEALRECKLAWRDVIVHTFLQSPASSYRRARVSHGPWRYSRYKITLFLLTVDGVREISAELDFKKSEFDGIERTNYRFDAVASVRVITRYGNPQSLELTLVNGEPRKMHVVDEEPSSLKVEEDSQEKLEDLVELTLESSGFSQTLHVLEGIAAEGKQWIQRS